MSAIAARVFHYFPMTLQEALEFHRNGHLDAAEKAYRLCLLESPDDMDALHLLGVLLQKRGDLATAEELIRRAIAQAPDQAQFHLSLGGVQLQRGDSEAARASFETALQLDPNSAEAYSVLGHLAMFGGDMQSAEHRFNVGRRASDEDPTLLLGLGNVYLSRDDSANAVKFLMRAAERAPNDAAIQTSLGRALVAQGAFGIAEQAFGNALRERPDFSPAKLFLARLKMRQGKDEEARDLFDTLVARGEQIAESLAGLGDVARKHQHFARALKYYRRALAYDASQSGVWLACAQCMERMGDLAAAVKYLSSGLERTPTADRLRGPLIKLLERMGRNDEAADVRRLAPTQPAA
jgi:Tfp pilus assembly protein PilF